MPEPIGGDAFPLASAVEADDKLLGLGPTVGRPAILAHDLEAALLEDPERADVVLRDPRVERPGRVDPEKDRQRPRPDAAAPELAAEPVADVALAVRVQLTMLPATCPSTTIVRFVIAGSLRIRLSWATNVPHSRAGNAAISFASGSR